MVHLGQFHGLRIGSFFAALFFGVLIAIADHYKRRGQNFPFGIRFFRLKPDYAGQPKVAAAYRDSTSEPRRVESGRVARLPHIGPRFTPALPLAAFCPLRLPSAKAALPSRTAQGFSEFEVA